MQNLCAMLYKHAVKLRHVQCVRNVEQTHGEIQFIRCGKYCADTVKFTVYKMRTLSRHGEIQFIRCAQFFADTVKFKL